MTLLFSMNIGFGWSGIVAAATDAVLAAGSQMIRLFHTGTHPFKRV